MENINIDNIQSLQTAITADNVLIFRNDNDYSVTLSYKEKLNGIRKYFQDPTIINTYKTQINTLISQLRTLSSSILTRASAKSTYATLDTYQAKKEQLLSYDSMNDMITKYVNDDDMKNKAAQAKTAAEKLADEMTDFVGAAMVGINQSNASKQTSPTPK